MIIISIAYDPEGVRKLQYRKIM